MAWLASLNQFEAKCVAGTLTPTLKSEAMVLCRKWKSLSVSGSCLLVMHRGAWDGQLVCGGGNSTAGVALRRELSLLIYQSIYIPTFSYAHESWVVTERTKTHIQAADMSVPWRVAELSLRDRVRSLNIQMELWVEPLLPSVERSPLRWSELLIRMPPGHLPLEFFWACPTERSHWADPELPWAITYLIWSGNTLGSPRWSMKALLGRRMHPS